MTAVHVSNNPHPAATTPKSNAFISVALTQPGAVSGKKIYRWKCLNSKYGSAARQFTRL
jgi:hypothetical protein